MEGSSTDWGAARAHESLPAPRCARRSCPSGFRQHPAARCSRVRGDGERERLGVAVPAFKILLFSSIYESSEANGIALTQQALESTSAAGRRASYPSRSLRSPLAPSSITTTTARRTSGS